MRKGSGSTGIEGRSAQATTKPQAVLVSELALGNDNLGKTINPNNGSGATSVARVDHTSSYSPDEAAVKRPEDGRVLSRSSRITGQRPLRSRTRYEVSSTGDESHSCRSTQNPQAPIQHATQVGGSEPERSIAVSRSTRPANSQSVSVNSTHGLRVAPRPYTSIEPSKRAGQKEFKSSHDPCSIQVGTDSQISRTPASATALKRLSSVLSDSERRLSMSEWLEQIQIGGNALMVLVPRPRALYTLHEEEEEGEEKAENESVSLPSSPESSAPVTPISGPFPLPDTLFEISSGSSAIVTPLLGSRRCGARGTRRSDFGGGQPF